MTIEPKGTLSVRVSTMPADANASGDIFGGWLMSRMDIGAAIHATERAGGRTATVAVDAMHFIEPVYVGDTVCIYTSIEKEGQTSMVIYVEAWAKRSRIGERVKVTDAKFTFVALDENGKPTPIPATTPHVKD